MWENKYANELREREGRVKEGGKGRWKDGYITVCPAGGFTTDDQSEYKVMTIVNRKTVKPNG